MGSWLSVIVSGLAMAEDLHQLEHLFFFFSEIEIAGIPFFSAG